MNPTAPTAPCSSQENLKLEKLRAMFNVEFTNTGIVLSKKAVCEKYIHKFMDKYAQFPLDTFKKIFEDTISGHTPYVTFDMKLTVDGVVNFTLEICPPYVAPTIVNVQFQKVEQKESDMFEFSMIRMKDEIREKMEEKEEELLQKISDLENEVDVLKERLEDETSSGRIIFGKELVSKEVEAIINDRQNNPAVCNSLHSCWGDFAGISSYTDSACCCYKLSHFPHLQSLITQSDFNELRKCKNLKCLYLASPNLIDLSFLAGLTNIVDLRFGDCPNLFDFSPISNLVNIQKLVLNSTNIEDLSLFANLTQLKELGLGNTKAHNRTILSGISGLLIVG